MQAYSPVLPVGAQHYYKNSFDALKSIWRAEKFRGLVRGVDAAALRTAMGSSVCISCAPTCIIALTVAFIGATALIQLDEEPTSQPWHCARRQCMDISGKQYRFRTLCRKAFVQLLSVHLPELSLVCLQLAMMQPTDTVLTRMYNQPTIPTPDGRHVGALYKNPIDCLWKTLKAEGPLGWYKGESSSRSVST